MKGVGLPFSNGLSLRHHSNLLLSDPILKQAWNFFMG